MLRWRLNAPEGCAAVSSPPQTGPVSWQRYLRSTSALLVLGRSYRCSPLVYRFLRLCVFGVADAPWRQEPSPIQGALENRCGKSENQDMYPVASWSKNKLKSTDSGEQYQGPTTCGKGQNSRFGGKNCRSASWKSPSSRWTQEPHRLVVLPGSEIKLIWRQTQRSRSFPSACETRGHTTS